MRIAARLRATSSASRRRPGPRRPDFSQQLPTPSPRCCWAVRRTPAPRDRRTASQAAWREWNRATSPLSKPLALRLHAVDMFRTRESAGTYVGGITLDRGLDHRCEIAVAADKFRRPRRQAQHILQHQYLTVAGRTGADADGGNGDGFGDLPRQRFGDRLDHHGERTGLRDRGCVVLDRLPAALLAALRAKRAERVDRLRRQPDMAHHRNA